jgi:hypothetical protein
VHLGKLDLGLTLDADLLHGWHKTLLQEPLEVLTGFPQVENVESIFAKPGDVELTSLRACSYCALFTSGQCIRITVAITTSI